MGYVSTLVTLKPMPTYVSSGSYSGWSNYDPIGTVFGGIGKLFEGIAGFFIILCLPFILAYVCCAVCCAVGTVATEAARHRRRSHYRSGPPVIMVQQHPSV